MENRSQYDIDTDKIIEAVNDNSDRRRREEELYEKREERSKKRAKVAKKNRVFKNVSVSLVVVAAAVSIGLGAVKIAKPAIENQLAPYRSYQYAIPYAQEELVDAGYGYFEGDDFYLYEGNDYSGLDMTIQSNPEGLATLELYERAINDAENIKDVDKDKSTTAFYEKDKKEATRFTNSVMVDCKGGSYTLPQIFEGGGSINAVLGVNNGQERINLACEAITTAVEKAKNGDNSSLKRIVNEVENRNLDNTKGGR